MGEHSSKRRPSPQFVAMRWASVSVPKCVAEWYKARCGSRRAKYVCKHTCAADTDNGNLVNEIFLSFDNKAPGKGDVFAAIAKSVFFG